MLYMVRDVAAIEKDGKGWDFSNTWTAQGAVLRRPNQGIKAIVPFGPTTSAPPSGYVLTELKV
jgi:hypothetical protein